MLKKAAVGVEELTMDPILLKDLMMMRWWWWVICVDRVIYSTDLCQHIRCATKIWKYLGHSEGKFWFIYILRLCVSLKTYHPSSLSLTMLVLGEENIRSVCLEGLDILLFLYLNIYVRCNSIFNHICVTILQNT